MAKNQAQGNHEDSTSDIKLTSTSPFSYDIAAVGDKLEIRPTRPRHTEFRGSGIGTAVETYLVFKGITKIGMIPQDVVARLGKESIGKRCTIVRMDEKKKIIAIAILPKKPAAT